MASTYEMLQQIAQNDANMRKLQQLLSITEGSSAFANPYLAKGGTRNGQWASYDNHPYFIDPKAATWNFKWKNGKQDTATAQGKYMIRQKTWQGINNALGRKLTFSPQDQDIAMALLVKQRGALQDVQNGNWNEVFRKLGGEWASLPTSPYAQHKFSNKGFAAALAKVGIDPSQAGYGGQPTATAQKVSPTPAQHPTPTYQNPTLTSLAGGSMVAELPQIASQAVSTIFDKTPTQPQVNRVMGLDYLNNYFKELNKKQQTPVASGI